MATLRSQNPSTRVRSPKPGDYHAARNRAGRPPSEIADPTNAKRCKRERCPNILRPDKARHWNAKYCDRCATALLPTRKQAAEERKAYMEAYMRDYRLRHPGLSTKYVRKHRAAKLAATPRHVR